MRYFVLLLVLVCATGTALAKPKVAVAPIKGDKQDKVAGAIAEALASSAKVIGTTPTQRTLTRLGLKAGDLDSDDAKKVMLKVGADALVQGKLEKEDGTQTLKVSIFSSDKNKPAKFTIQFKTVSAKFKEQLKETLAKKLGGGGDDDDDDQVAARKKKKEEEERKADEERKKKEDDDRRATEEKKRKDDERADTDKKKKKKKKDKEDPDESDRKKDKDKEVAEVEPDDTVKVKKKRKKRGVEEEVAPRRVAARLDAGAFGGVRKLTYSATMSPPPVGTRAVAARVEGEVYPFALGETQSGAAAGLGLGIEFEKTLGLAITAPGATAAIPIAQGHYSVGGRFRINANATTMLVFGVDYAASKYVADRTAGQIDFPDTDYKAVVPSACVMKVVAPKIAVFGRLNGQLILDTGPIQDKSQYGAATVYGVGVRAGVDIGLTDRIALRFAGDFNNIAFKFKGNGAIAMTRGVTAAADRVFGLATTLAVTY